MLAAWAFAAWLSYKYQYRDDDVRYFHCKAVDLIYFEIGSHVQLELCLGSRY